MKTEFLLFGNQSKLRNFANQSQLRNFDDLVGIRIKQRKFDKILGNNFLFWPEMG